MSESGHVFFASQTAFFAADEALQVVTWNEAAERLTGIPVDDALGRPCWDVIRGVDGKGNLLCHKGCSRARIVREGHCLPATQLIARTPTGPRRVELETITVSQDGPPLFLHVMRPAPERPEERAAPQGPAAALTARQHEILELLAKGKSAKAIAGELGIRLATVRNHISAVLCELGAHSQLEAVARARERALL